jgi:hypothetical protein
VADRLYTSGRRSNWVKKPSIQRETLIIAGLRSTKENGTASISAGAMAAS